MSVCPSARIRASLLAAIVAVSVTACGSDEVDEGADTSAAAAVAASTTAPAAPSSAPAPTTQPTSTEADAVEPTAVSTIGSADASTTRTVEHALGTSEIPAEPQRIVVAGRRGTLALLLELGIEPVGALDATFIFGQPFHPMIADQADAVGVEPIGKTDTGPNLEHVARLDPDLIIGSANDFAEVYEQLSKIAPTVGIQWDYVDPLANVHAVGEALDMEAETTAMVDEFDAAIADAAARLENPGTVSIVGLFAPDDTRIYRAGNLVGTLVEQLGGQVVPGEDELPLDPEDPVVNFVSLENLTLASGDSLIAFVNEGKEADTAYREMEAEPLIQALPAFQSGRVLELDPQPTFGTTGMAGLHLVLGQLEEFFAG